MPDFNIPQSPTTDIAPPSGYNSAPIIQPLNIPNQQQNIPIKPVTFDDVAPYNPNGSAQNKFDVLNKNLIETPFKYASKYNDNDLGYNALDPNIEQEYADKQSFLVGLANRVVKFGASALGSFIGTLASTGNMLYAQNNEDAAVQQAPMAKWINSLEEYFPNYKSEAQLNSPFLTFINPFTLKSAISSWGEVAQQTSMVVGSMAASAIVDAGISALGGEALDALLIPRQLERAFKGLNTFSELIGDEQKYKTFISALNNGSNISEQIVNQLNTVGNFKKGLDVTRVATRVLINANGMAVMTGADTYNRVKEDLESKNIDEYGNFNGTANLKESIDSVAKKAAGSVIPATYGFMLATEVFGLPAFLKPASVAIKDAEAAATKNIVANIAENDINKITLNSIKPEGFINKTLTNIPQLAQAHIAGIGILGGQHVITEANTKYYENAFNAKSNNEVQSLASYYANSIKGLFTTQEGGETLLNGLLFGLITKGVEHFMVGKPNSKAFIDQSSALLNSSGVSDLFDNAKNEALIGNELHNQMLNASLDKDIYAYKNAQQDSIFNFFTSAIKGYKFDVRLQQLDRLKELSPDQFKAYWGFDLTDATKKSVSEYVDQLKQKGNDIKDLYNKVETVFGQNPFDSKKDTENYQAYDIYKTELTNSLFRQKAVIERTIKISDRAHLIAPAADINDLINLTSVDGIKHTIGEFNRRIEDLKQAEELAYGNNNLTNSYKKERDFLQNKVEGLNDFSTEGDIYSKDIFGHINDIYNYYNNGKSLNGDSKISYIDTVLAFNDTKDIHSLRDSFQDSIDYYKALSAKGGFEKLKTDIAMHKQLLLQAAHDEWDFDEAGNLRRKPEQKSEKPVEQQVKEQYGLDTADDVFKKIDEKDPTVIAKVLNPNYENEPDSEEAKIAKGEVPITDDHIEAAKERFKADVENSTTKQSQPSHEEIPMNETAEERKARIQKRENDAKFPTQRALEEEAENADFDSEVIHKLPTELRGAKPTYNYGDKSYDLSFDNDVDKAAYIIAQTKKSKRDADYLDFVMKAKDMSEQEARDYGKEVRDNIKQLAKEGNGGLLNVPNIENVVKYSKPSVITKSISNIADRVWDKFKASPIKLLNRIYSPKATTTFPTDFLAGLHKKLFSTSNASEYNNKIIKKLRLEIYPSTEGMKGNEFKPASYFEKGNKVQYKNLYRKGYDKDVVLYIENTPVGFMPDSQGLFIKRNGEYVSLHDATPQEYMDATGNPIDTFDKFKKEIISYDKLYKKITEGFDGSLKKVSNEELLELANIDKSYGSPLYTTNETKKFSTLIKDLKYRGKGDVVLSFPMNYNSDTNTFERQEAPVVLNSKELNDADKNYALNFIANNLKTIHNLNSRYVYLFRLPDGTFNTVSIFAARPVNEGAEHLNDFVIHIKDLANTSTPEELKDINNELKDAFYISHSKNERTTNMHLSVDNNKNVVLNLYNTAFKYGTKITISNEELSKIDSIDNLTKLLNNKIEALSKTNINLQRLDIKLKPESFKRNIKDDDEVSSIKDIEDKIAVSVFPEVFSNPSITLKANDGLNNSLINENDVPPLAKEQAKEKEVEKQQTSEKTVTINTKEGKTIQMTTKTDEKGKTVATSFKTIIEPNVKKPIMAPVKSESPKSDVPPLSKVKPIDNLKTFDLNDMEGKKQTKANTSKIEDNIINHPSSHMIDGGESFEDAYNRVTKSIKDILATGKDGSVIVTHNTVFGLIKLLNERGYFEGNKDDKDFLDNKEFRTEYTKRDSNPSDDFNITANGKTIHIVRHGETEDNVKGIFRTHDTKLTENGVKAARDLSDKYSQAPEIYTSSIPRAVETANILEDKNYEPRKSDIQAVKDIDIDKGIPVADTMVTDNYSSIVSQLEKKGLISRKGC